MTRSWEDAYKSALEKLACMERFEEQPEKMAGLIKSDLEVVAQAATGNIAATEAMLDVRQKIYDLIECSKQNVEKAKAEMAEEKKRSSGAKAYEKALHLGK